MGTILALALLVALEASQQDPSPPAPSPTPFLQPLPGEQVPGEQPTPSPSEAPQQLPAAPPSSAPSPGPAARPEPTAPPTPPAPRRTAKEDAMLAQTVRARLARDADTGVRGIQVSVDNGIALLRGAVPSPRSVDNAVASAMEVPGVGGVASALTVAPALRADDVLGARITEALLRSASVDARGIVVQVSDGVVTLRGTTRSRSSRAAAERRARQAGARKVVNLLTVATPKAP